MARRVRALFLQAAAFAAIGAGVATFLWLPDSHWFWLVLSALVPVAFLLGSVCLQSAAVAAVTGGKARFGFQLMIGILLLAIIAVIWRFADRWWCWGLFWLLIPPLLGPSFVAGRWRTPRFSWWFPPAVLIPVLLVSWTPHLAVPALDVSIFSVRLLAAAVVLLWCLVRAFEDWASGGSPGSAI